MRQLTEIHAQIQLIAHIDNTINNTDFITIPLKLLKHIKLHVKDDKNKNH